MMKKLFLMCLLSGALVQAQSLERQVIGSAGTSFSNASAQLDFTVGELVVTTITDGTTELTQGFHQTNLQVEIKVSPAAFLSGPFNDATDLMRDDLRAAGHVPVTSPYMDAITTTSGVLAVTGNDAIIDWVFVELRDENTNTTIIDSSSALMQADGDIVGVDGTSPLSFNVTAKNYYVVVKHRNHLGIMSASPVALSSTAAVVDFRNEGGLFGATHPAQINRGTAMDKQAMWLGDANGSNSVNFSGSNNDTNQIKSSVLTAPGNILGLDTYPYPGYHNEDVDMDGIARFSGNGNDSNLIKLLIDTHPGNFLGLLTYTAAGQVPN